MTPPIVLHLVDYSYSTTCRPVCQEKDAAIISDVFSINLYSVLNASTGSFLDAILDGIAPPINVNIILITTNIIA